MNPSNWTLEPSAFLTVCLGVLLSGVLSVLYLMHPNFIDPIQFKLTDAIVVKADEMDVTGKVVVVDIDEAALEGWGQWPWPRSRLASLMEALAGKGAASIALDFIMPEPDRTSPLTLQDNDAVLADILSRGPFVLGYKFEFGDQADHQGDCFIHPIEIVHVQKPSDGAGGFRLYQAQRTICNVARLAHAAPYSGFLNGETDGDGRLRRLPLMIQYRQAVYPNLVLASLLTINKQQPVILKHRQGGQSDLTLGRHVIPVDNRGNLLIRFTKKRSNLLHIPAGQVLSGQVAEVDIKGRVVFVGLSASGLASNYHTPADGIYSAVEVHAQAVETILSGNHIRRHSGIVLAEIALAMLAALLFSLCIARCEFLITMVIGALGILASSWGAQIAFNNHQMLFSPLLPVVVIVACGLVLMLFKYWMRQREARFNMRDALVLIKNSQQELNAIIKTIPDIVFRLDASGRITFISPAVVKYKTQPEELIGKHILELVVPEDRHAANCRINERRTGERATADLEVRLKLSAIDSQEEGEERYFSISAEGIYTKSTPDVNSFLGTQGIAKDITQRKHLEHKLEQSRKMEVIGNLAAGVAHDLNNILSGVVSYPDLLLLDLPADDPMRDKIETIQRSGQRAAEIVQDMLMIARRNVKVHDIINLNEIVTSYLKTPEFRNVSKSHPKTQFTTDLADDLMNVKGSPLHISKVIMNLIGNAAEAMPVGGSIHIRTRNRYLDTAIDRFERIPEGEYVMLRITDEGVGIPPEELPRVFEPFYSKKRMGRSGSGLGMTVVWNTIKDHGGFVDIKSQEGEGTQFDVLLPATREEDNRTRQRVVLQDYTGTERLLVVDDIPEQRDIAVRMLGKLGYKVVSASGGEEAVAYLRTHAVDLLVLDMVMPEGIDGMETYRRILDIHPGQKAIIASGYAPSERVKGMQDLGAGEYIRKPYTLEKIGLAVRRELDRKPS